MQTYHTYLLKNRKNTPVEVRSEGVAIAHLDPGATIYFFSPYGDLEPLFLSEGVDCTIDSFVDVDPDFLLKCKPIEEIEPGTCFLLKCKPIEEIEPGTWQQEGF